MTFSNLYRIFHVEKEWHKFLLVPISIKKSFFKKSSTPLELERASWISPNKDWYEGGGPYRGKKKMKLEVALTLTTISIPILQTRMAPHSLTLYTLTSVWIFSILFAIYFILYWQWEFFLRSKLLRLWSFSLFSWSKWTIHLYDCKEKLEAGHS